MAKPDVDWNNLYEYVKKEIMEYPDDYKLPKYIVLRLRGLAKGQFLANNKQTPMANYEYKTILYTFKICKSSILVGFKSNNTKFKDEQHRFNYAMVIIENNINDMVIRLKNAKVAKEKTESLILDNIEHDGAEYIPKTKKENDNLKDLW
jgi:hypothetical protein